MELLQLKYFVTVARMLNISKAAEYHRIPQPAMSKTISNLEKELGTPLFLRHNNRISLTDEGDTFYQKILKALIEIDEAKSEVQKADDIPHGEITLLVKEHRTNMLKCIAEFKKKYPNVRFKVYYDEKAAGYYDFCVASVLINREFDKSILLTSEQMYLIASSRSPLTAKGTLSISELRQQEFAVTTVESYQWKKMIEYCNRAGFVPKLTAEFGDIQCLAEFVDLGMAVAIGPKSSYMELGRNLSFLELNPEIQRPTFLFWRSTGTTKMLQLFKESIIEFFSR